MAAASTLSSFRLVLVGPRHAGNVGACARLAANFGVADWVLVDPQCDPTGWDARKFATGTARATLDQVRVVSSVREALDDCQAAIALTRRSGKTRIPALDVTELPTLAGEIRGRIALVFGNEESGLSRAETEPCTHLCSIATSPEMGSLNLSHAVAIVLSRLYDSTSSASGRRSARVGAAPLKEVEGLFTHWRELLVDLGLTSAGNPDRLLRVLRGGLERATLTRVELRAFRGLLSKTQVALGLREQGKRITKK